MMSMIYKEFSEGFAKDISALEKLCKEHETDNITINAKINGETKEIWIWFRDEKKDNR